MTWESGSTRGSAQACELNHFAQVVLGCKVFSKAASLWLIRNLHLSKLICESGYGWGPTGTASLFYRWPPFFVTDPTCGHPGAKVLKMGSLCKSKALCCSVVVRTTLLLYWQVKAGYFHQYQSIYPTIQVANSCPYQLWRYYLHTNIAKQCWKTLENALAGLNTQGISWPIDPSITGLRNPQLYTQASIHTCMCARTHACTHTHTHTHTTLDFWRPIVVDDDSHMRMRILLVPELHHRSGCKADRIDRHCWRAWSCTTQLPVAVFGQRQFNFFNSVLYTTTHSYSDIHIWLLVTTQV